MMTLLIPVAVFATLYAVIEYVARRDRLANRGDYERGKRQERIKFLIAVLRTPHGIEFDRVRANDELQLLLDEEFEEEMD